MSRMAPARRDVIACPPMLVSSAITLPDEHNCHLHTKIALDALQGSLGYGSHTPIGWGNTGVIPLLGDTTAVLN